MSARSKRRRPTSCSEVPADSEIVAQKALYLPYTARQLHASCRTQRLVRAATPSSERRCPRWGGMGSPWSSGSPRRCSAWPVDGSADGNLGGCEGTGEVKRAAAGQATPGVLDSRGRCRNPSMRTPTPQIAGSIPVSPALKARIHGRCMPMTSAHVCALAPTCLQLDTTNSNAAGVCVRSSR